MCILSILEVWLIYLIEIAMRKIKKDQAIPYEHEHELHHRKFAEGF